MAADFFEAPVPGESRLAIQKRPVIFHPIDHLIWGVPDLEAGIEEIERLMGVRPVIGGSHPGLGTHNALMGLGGRIYFEIMALDPAQTEVRALGERLRGLEAGRLVGWVVEVSDLDRLAREAAVAGYPVEPVFSMFRDRPDGNRLSWRFGFVQGQMTHPLVPGLIDWGSSPHPSTDLPQGCELTGWQLVSAQPEETKRILEALSVEVPIRKGSPPRLEARLLTPKGERNLT